MFPGDPTQGFIGGEGLGGVVEVSISFLHAFLFTSQIKNEEQEVRAERVGRQWGSLNVLSRRLRQKEGRGAQSWSSVSLELCVSASLKTQVLKG